MRAERPNAPRRNLPASLYFVGWTLFSCAAAGNVCHGPRTAVPGRRPAPDWTAAAAPLAAAETAELIAVWRKAATLSLRLAKSQVFALPAAAEWLDDAAWEPPREFCLAADAPVAPLARQAAKARFAIVAAFDPVDRAPAPSSAQPHPAPRRAWIFDSPIYAAESLRPRPRCEGRTYGAAALLYVDVELGARLDAGPGAERGLHPLRAKIADVYPFLAVDGLDASPDGRYVAARVGRTLTYRLSSAYTLPHGDGIAAKIYDRGGHFAAEIALTHMRSRITRAGWTAGPTTYRLDFTVTLKDTPRADSATWTAPPAIDPAGTPPAIPGGPSSSGGSAVAMAWTTGGYAVTTVEPRSPARDNAPVWKAWPLPAQAAAPGRSIEAAEIRPDPRRPHAVARVYRFAAADGRLTLVAGRADPPSTTGRAGRGLPAPDEIDPARPLLYFAGGFQAAHCPGAIRDGGGLIRHPQPGLAALVLPPNSAPIIGKWEELAAKLGAGFDSRAGVAFRQNCLPLLASGEPYPGPDIAPLGMGWGLLPHVWRTAIGSDERGNLYYAAANSVSPFTFARALRMAGLRDAMALDINDHYAMAAWLLPDGKGGYSYEKLDPRLPGEPYRLGYANARDYLLWQFNPQPSKQGE